MNSIMPCNGYEISETRWKELERSTELLAFSVSFLNSMIPVSYDSLMQVNTQIYVKLW